MKTFKDLEFKPHSEMDGLSARMNFKNGYGVSIIRFKSLFGGYGSYTSNEKEWEIAILYKGSNTYTSGITDHVIGHCSLRKVTSVMKKVQELRRSKK